MAKFQSQLKGAKADSQNPFFKSHYADLGSVWEAIQEPLTKNGLSVTQLSNWKEGMGWHVITRILHTSGEWCEGYFPIVAAKPNDPQAVGSATSYARRYALAAALGVYQTDDDGNAAVSRGTVVQKDLRPEMKKTATEALSGKVVDPKKCAHKWFQSKFNKDEQYCSICKAKRAMTAQPQQDLDSTDNIPF